MGSEMGEEKNSCALGVIYAPAMGMQKNKTDFLLFIHIDEKPAEDCTAGLPDL
jgi:hypothetical protein